MKLFLNQTQPIKNSKNTKNTTQLKTQKYKKYNPIKNSKNTKNTTQLKTQKIQPKSLLNPKMTQITSLGFLKINLIKSNLQ